MCDKLCAKYGDCCVDSPYFLSAEQRRSAASFTCANLKQFGGVYMMSTCPHKWKSMETRVLCETANASDPIAAMPVTSSRTGITYKNAHCALCHNDVRDTRLDVWKPRLECPSLLQSQLNKSADFLDLIRWNGEKGQWGLQLDTWHPCHIDPVIPETSAHIIRRCQASTIHTCAINWTNTEVRSRCEAYTSLVYEGATSYRNPHCAVCNNVPLQSLTCFKIAHRSFYNKDFSPNAFAILFDLSGKPDSLVGKVKPCEDDQLYDPFYKKCRHVICPEDHAFSQGKCVVQAHNDDYDDIENIPKNLTTPTNSTFRTCPKFLLSADEYVLGDMNQTIYIAAYDRTYGPAEFAIHSDKSVEICSGSLGKILISKFGDYMGYITAVGLGVSIVFLVLHLIAFWIVKDLQNLSGKNLASLCIALLIADCSFLTAQSLTPGTNPCIASAVFTHYGYLASFFWMLTMAFDIWRTLKLATFELRVSSGKQWKKFLIYSAWSWLAPAVFTVSAVLVDLAPAVTVDVYLRPLFGVHSCWFGHRQSLLVFFALPLAVVMICNIIFFASSAHMIFSTTSTTRYTASGSTQRDFRLYIRLALVMGLTWITGLLAGFLNVDALWYAFIALNAFQGLFIFLAFTCNEKVIRGIKSLRYESEETDKERRPPSFSWSGGSSDTTNKSHLGSSSDDSLKENKLSKYQANLQVKRLESPFNTIDKNKSFDYDMSYRSQHLPEPVSQPSYLPRPDYDNSAKINPIYGSAAPAARRGLDDTLY